MRYNIACWIAVATILAIVGGCKQQNDESNPPAPTPLPISATAGETTNTVESQGGPEQSSQPVLDLRSSGQATIQATTDTAAPEIANMETPVTTPAPLDTTPQASQPPPGAQSVPVSTSATESAIPEPAKPTEQPEPAASNNTSPTVQNRSVPPPPETSDQFTSVSLSSISPEPAVPLTESSSPYLRQSAKSAVKWSSWSKEAFDRAKAENKPLLIDIGANWSHSCRSMNDQTYADKSVSSLVNENFVAVRVDCDERPDIDSRYQSANLLIHNDSSEGYPLIAFALPDGRAFESVQYLPAKTAGDSKGMADVLAEIAQLYTQRLPDVQKQADSVEQYLARTGSPAQPPAGSEADTAKAVQTAIVPKFNKTNPGFDSPPVRFPWGTPLLFLLQRLSDTGDRTAGDMAAAALAAYARSGLRDHVMGGYFHYSADDKFTKPHFEKLLYVQAELLSANCLAFAANGKRTHRESAMDIRKLCKDSFEAQDGGFFTSQDSDMEPGDNGSYYTWTKAEVEKIAGTGNDTKVFMRYLNMDGEESGRHVLYASEKLQAAADTFKVGYDDAQQALNNVRKKLHDARMEQKAPSVNKTRIASWNAAMIVAYLDAFKYTGDNEAREFALKSADFLLSKMYDHQKGMARVYRNKPAVYGLLDDNVHVASALIHCFEVSGERKYLEPAESLMNLCEQLFAGPEGLYRDSAIADANGLLPVTMVNLTDNRIMSANAVAAMNWYQLALLEGKREYTQRARRMVQAVSGNKALENLNGAGFGRVASMITNGAPKALIIGKTDDPITAQMRDAALPVFRMGKVVEVLTPEEAANTDYPPAKDGKPIGYVCTTQSCAPTVRDPEKLVEAIKTFGKKAQAQAPAPSNQPAGEQASGSE